MTKIYNTGPYYDDFDETKGFHQVMFKPGYAVQSRELTQMQTILRKQIERFGNHIFQNGQVVIPGNSFADLNVDYVQIESLFDGGVVDPTLFDGRVIVGTASGVRAQIRRFITAQTETPITFYISYVSGGVVQGQPSGVLKFIPGEDIYIETASVVRARVRTNGIGTGAMAFVNQGVYYINGAFAYVPKQSIVIDAFGNKPNCHVLLEVSESLVDETIDETLLDPAQGSYNYAAPGADRVRLKLSLVAVALGSTLPEGSIELMRYSNGELQLHSTKPKYQELEKSLAQRTYDESGNYIVSGLELQTRAHSDPDKMVYEIGAGRAYVQGFLVENQYKKQLVVDRARTPQSIKSTAVDMRPTFGQYMFVQNIRGGFGIKKHETVSIWESSNTTELTALQIGTAKIYGVDYYTGDPLSTNAIYKVWLYDIQYTGDFTSDDAGGIRSTSGSASICHQFSTPGTVGQFSIDQIITSGTGVATVQYWDFAAALLYAHRHTRVSPLPRRGETITAPGGASARITLRTSVFGEGVSSLIFNLPKQYAKSLKKDGLFDLDYTVQTELSISTNGSGSGSATIAAGTFDPIEVGTFQAFQPTGVISQNLFQLPTPTLLQITGGPASSTVKVYCNVSKNNIAPRIKTRTTKTLNLVQSTGDIQLPHTDVIRLVQIVDTVGDITNRYTLDNGQRDYIYLRGVCLLAPGQQNPTGAVTVTYEHYEHGASGDFFCVDSYENDASFIENMPMYISSGGYSYNMSQCIDFRPSVGVDNTLVGADSRQNDIIQTATSFICDLSYYVGRVDAVSLSATGDLSATVGLPAEIPYASSVGLEKFQIFAVRVPPYTRTPDSCLVERIGTKRSTMRDIEAIGKRIDRLENYVTITQGEQDVLNYEIIDAKTGLNRFKTGYLVEQFQNPFNSARTTQQQWGAQFFSDLMTANLQMMKIPLAIHSTKNVYLSNGVFIKNYAETPLIKQPLSSRVTNLNPFLVISWVGNLQITPRDDVWVDVRQEPDIFETKTETIDIVVPAPQPPPTPPSPPWEPGPVDPIPPAPGPTPPVIPPPLEPTDGGPGHPPWPLPPVTEQPTFTPVPTPPPPEPPPPVVIPEPAGYWVAYYEDPWNGTATILAAASEPYTIDGSTGNDRWLYVPG